MLWVDKHRPKSIKDLTLHDEVSTTLKNLVAGRDFPHLLFYGPPGGGKKTRVMAMLNEHYGNAVLSPKLETKTVQVSESKTIDLVTLSSPHHLDLNPSDAGNNDRAVVMTMIKEVAETVPLIGRVAAVGGTGGSSLASKGSSGFKVIVLNEVDKMTRVAQQALRRTMEKYSTTCRLILVCSSTSKLIPPLRSRCLGIRVPAASPTQIRDVIQTTCKIESQPMPNDAVLQHINQQSAGNMRRALLLLETGYITKCDMQGGTGTDIPLPEWMLYTEEIAVDITKEQTPKQLHEIRGKLYELLGQCIPPDLILQRLATSLSRYVDERGKRSLVRWAAKYDHSMKLGTKPIMHLEAFVAKAMSVIVQLNRGTL